VLFNPQNAEHAGPPRTHARKRQHANATPRASPPARRAASRLVAANPLAAPRNHLGVRRGFRVGCAPGDSVGGGGDGAAAWLSSAVEEKVDELLRRDEVCGRYSMFFMPPARSMFCLPKRTVPWTNGSLAVELPGLACLHC
jgi:hypothetical protein